MKIFAARSDSCNKVYRGDSISAAGFDSYALSGTDTSNVTLDNMPSKTLFPGIWRQRLSADDLDQEKDTVEFRFYGDEIDTTKVYRIRLR
jgi:hypothetical protein